MRRERVVAEQLATVRSARLQLAEASWQVARYGAIGASHLGLSSDHSLDWLVSSKPTMPGG